MGIKSKSIRPIYDIIMKNKGIPTHHKMPFALMLANSFMNGAYPPGFRRMNSCTLSRFFKDRTDDSVYYSPKKAKLHLLDADNSDIIKFSYECTKSTTLVRWSHAIEMINEFHVKCD